MSSPTTSVAAPSWINRLGQWVEGQAFQRAIIALILLNAVTMGLETADNLPPGLLTALRVVDAMVLSIFVCEILGKLIYRRARFFLDGWNVFDFFVVAVALIPDAGPFAVLRTLRVLRLLRLLSVVPHLRQVVNALTSAIPGISTVGSIILLIFYVGAILTTNLFGASFPGWFGDIGLSMYTLFQIMTLESWSMGIVRPVMDVYPYAWAFFIPFISVTTFAILNLLIGIVVSAMSKVQEQERQAAGIPSEADSRVLELQEIRALRQEIAELRQHLNRPQ